VVEKLQRISKELGSVGAVLPGFSSGSVRRLLQQAKEDAPQLVGELLETSEARRAAGDLSRLATRNREEIERAERYVAQLGTIEDFEAQLGELLRTAFRGWDDGGAVQEVGQGVARVLVPARLRPQLGTAVIERATFRRDVALEGADQDERNAPELLSPAHPLVEATLRALRDEAAAPDFPHRFDVVAGEPEGLVFSFAVRFVDGEGRTAEESLLAVEVALDGSVSRSPEADMARLGIDAPGPATLPDKARIAVWQDAFVRLYEAARQEAERRAEERRLALVELAEELVAAEREALGRWRGEEERRVELLALGRDPQLSFESAQEYERLMGKLEEEYERRRAGIRDRARVRLAGVDLIGGRLIVSAVGS